MYQQFQSADIFQFMQEMFSSEYKSNYWAVNSDLFLYSIIKSGGEIPHRQAQVTRPEVLLFGMGNYALSLWHCNVSTGLCNFFYIYCIYSFNFYIFMFKQCYQREYKDEKGIVYALKMYAV